MAVTITNILNQQVYNDYMEAKKLASIAYSAHFQAEKDAFMALMAEIGVSIGDKVTVIGRYKSGTAILTEPHKFAQIKKDGTASQREFHVYGNYTVEKFTPTPE